MQAVPADDVGRTRQQKWIYVKIWIFFLQKRMDSLQEAFFHPPEPCEARFIIDARALFDYFWTVEQKHPPIIFNITQIGFVWKKKVIYT